MVITHLTHPWGPPWTLETLGDPWRPLATCLKMTNFPQLNLKKCVLWDTLLTTAVFMATELLKAMANGIGYGGYGF